MQFNAHVEIVDGVEHWWADADRPGFYVAADSWDELWRLAREVSAAEPGSETLSMIRPRDVAP